MKVIIRVNKHCVLDFMHNQSTLGQKLLPFLTLIFHTICISSISRFFYQAYLSLCECQYLLSWKRGQSCGISNPLFMKAFYSCHSCDVNIVVILLAELRNIVILGVMREWPYVDVIATHNHCELTVFWFLDLDESSNIKRKMLQKNHSEYVHYIEITLHSKTEDDSCRVSRRSDNFLDGGVEKLLRGRTDASSVTEIPESENVVFVDGHPKVFWSVENVGSWRVNDGVIDKIASLLFHVDWWDH